MIRNETPIARPWTLTRDRSFSKVIRFRNPDGTLQALDGSVFKLFVKPRGQNEFTIDADGPAGQKLIIDLDAKTVKIYISDESVDAFEWRTADIRFEQEDADGDKRQRFFGQLRFERSRA